MKYFKFLNFLIASMVFVSCNKEVLDRPPLDQVIDGPGFWRNEDDLRLFANSFYPQFFNGFATSFTADYIILKK